MLPVFVYLFCYSLVFIIYYLSVKFQIALRELMCCQQTILLTLSFTDMLHCRLQSTNTFKTRLDIFWHNHDIMYDFCAQLEGIGSEI